MKVKLLKSVVIGSVDNTAATRVGSVVEVDDTEGKELVKAGLAETSSGQVTAQARQAPATDNKMAPDATNKAEPNAVTAAGAARTVDTGAAPKGRRGAAAATGRGGKRSSTR